MEGPAISEAYGELLTRPRWDLFATLTNDPLRCRARVGLEGWQKAVAWFIFEWCKRDAYARGTAWPDERGRPRGPWINRYRHGKDFPMWVLAVERHRDERLHAHMLIAFRGRVRRLEYGIGHRVWNEHHGHAWFQRPRVQSDVAEYVSKYVRKSGGDALTFSGNFDAPRLGTW